LSITYCAHDSSGYRIMVFKIEKTKLIPCTFKIVFNSIQKVCEKLNWKIISVRYLGMSSISLIDCLTENMIKINVTVSDWKDAINAAGELLIKAKVAEPCYIQAMIDFCEQHNAYIVIAPGIALPHARPEDGAIKVGVSLVTLKKPVAFGHTENDPVDLIIALCAPDNKEHVNVIAELAERLMNKESVNKIRNAKSKKEVITILKS